MSRRFAAVLLLALPGLAAGAALPGVLADGKALPSLAPMLERTSPAVVNIATYTTYRNPLLEDPFFRRFFNIPNQERRTRSAGSGVVVDADKGYIVTNNHVVDRADEIAVTTADGRVLTAKLVGTDEQVDLAVLKVDPEDLTEIRFADSDDLRVGDFVVAIGNPFSLSQTVTSGIISALGRSGLGIEGFEDFIQTDASINPGNSGGALVDLRGDLVGINTAILAPSGGNVGIGFAIPANMVRAVMDELIEHGHVQRGYLGIAVQGLNAELAEAFGVDRRDGVVILDVEPDSPAGEAGLQQGDIIVRLGNKAIRRVSDFHNRSAVIFVGDEVTMEVLRDGRTRRVTLKIGDSSWEKMTGERVDRRLVGTFLQNFRSQEGGAGSGVVVTEVETGSSAWRYGLRPGDVIVGANRQSVRNLNDLRDHARGGGDQLLLRVYRAGQFGYVALR
ncbi:MAG: DegQ family serine endoprotease [Pseudomonadales bacterium]|jgi:serine protease Do/serine protease DegQ